MKEIRELEGLGLVEAVVKAVGSEETKNRELEAQDAKTLTLVVADTLKKVGEVLSAIGYYEKSEDFLLEFEDYQKTEKLRQKALSSKGSR